MVHLKGARGQALGDEQVFRESVIMGLACVYHGFTKWMTGLRSDSRGAVVQAVVFPGLRMWDEISFFPPSTEQYAAVYFSLQKNLHCVV